LGNRIVSRGKDEAYGELGREISIESDFSDFKILKCLFRVIFEALYVLLAIFKTLNNCKILTRSIKITIKIKTRNQ